LCPYKKGAFETVHRENISRLKVELREMLLQVEDAKDCQQTPEAKKEHGADSLSEPSKRDNLTHTLTSDKQ
jgi:hypothetical protein